MISSRSLNLLVASFASVGVDHYARYKGEKTPSLFDDAGNKSWDEDAHPRVEKGSKEAHGGQFTSKHGDSDNTKPKPQQLQPMFGSGYKPEAKAKQQSLFETMAGGGDQMPLFPDEATPDDLLSPKKSFDSKLESMKSRRDPEGISKNPFDVAEKSKPSAGENLLASQAKSAHLQPGEVSQRKGDEQKWDEVGIAPPDLSDIPGMAVNPLDFAGTNPLTEKTVYEPREINNRRIAARARRQRIEREKAPLFADQIASEQPDPVEELKKHDEGFNQRLEQIDSRAQEKWISNFHEVGKLPADEQGKLLTAWNASPGPKDHAYFAGFLAKWKSGKIDTSEVIDRSDIEDPELRQKVSKLDRTLSNLKQMRSAATAEAGQKHLDRRINEVESELKQLGINDSGIEPGATTQDPREELKQLNTKFAELSDKQIPMVRQQMELEKELRELRTTKYDPLMEPEGLKERNFKMRGVKKRLDNLNEKLRPLTKELDGVRDRSYEVMNAIREQDKAKEKQSPEAKQAASDMQPGLKNVASRMDQADAGFKDNLKELGGLTDEQAEKAFDYYKENKLFKPDAVMGKHTAKHGAYMDRDVIRKAAGLEPEAKADPSPGSQSGESMKTIPLRERKDYAIGLAKGGMKQTDLADHLMKRGVASVDARKLASDATFAAMVSNGLQEGAKATNDQPTNSEESSEPTESEEYWRKWPQSKLMRRGGITWVADKLRNGVKLPASRLKEAVDGIHSEFGEDLQANKLSSSITGEEAERDQEDRKEAAFILSELQKQNAAPSPARSDSPGIVMPSKTVSNDEAKPGDQLGLFGEATKAPAKDPPRLKVDEPKARQGGLFDTKGNPDQMDLFGDGVMPNELVYKPEAKPEAKKEETKPTPGENLLASRSKKQVSDEDHFDSVIDSDLTKRSPEELQRALSFAQKSIEDHSQKSKTAKTGSEQDMANYQVKAYTNEAKQIQAELGKRLPSTQSSKPAEADNDNPHNLDGQAGEDYRFTSSFVPKYVNEMGDIESRARAIRGLMKDSHPDAQAALAKDLVALSPETYAHIRNDKNIKGKDYEHAFSKSVAEHKQADKPAPTPGENFLASQKKSEVATPKTMDHEAIARKAVDEGTSVWAASKAMGQGGITDLSSEDRNKIAAAHEKLREEQTKAEEAKRSFVSPARAAAQAKFRARQEAEAKSELAKSHGEKAFEAAEAAESKDATPREVAKAAQAQLDKDYEYARASEIRNAGEDLKGSARHRVNAWKGLVAAEKDGTAEKLVNREGLHRLEPHDLMTHADKNPVTSLAMHYALRNFPPAPAGQTKTHSAEKNREQYLDAYRAIKDKANELAASTPDHAVGAAVSMMRDFVSNKLREFRGQEGSSALTAKDKYNPTANLLVKTYNALSSSTYKNKTGVMGRLEEFSKEASEKYGGIPDVNVKDMRDSKEFMENVSRHAKDVIEGQSLNKTFGKESEKRDVKRFDPSEAYVKIATRKGGRDLSKITADPIKAVDHMVKDMGMRGVQWGNSVTDDERKHHAGKALEAIADLADVTGLHPKDIALDGNLGLAIGARGKGTASAHYEPGNKVINLTRANGVGTLAHEWGHAFDHMLNGFGLETTNKGDKVVKRGGYMSNDTDTHHLIKKYGKNNELEYRSTTSDPEKMKEFGYEIEPRERSDIRDAYRKLNDVSKGFRERLNKALQDDVNSGKLSAKKANDYWNSDHEIFARSFEQYVMHKMKENGIENTYLAGMSKSHKYWPTPEESKAMAPAFDKIFEQYRKEKHGSGEPIKYSRHETLGMLERYFAEAFDHYAGKNQMKWDFGDDAEPVSGGKPSRIRSQQKVQEAANNGKLKIVGTTSDHDECERCGRKDLAKTIVVETLDAQGNGTGELHYYGSDCISKIMGKSEKHIETKVMEADYQKFLKSKKDAYSWQSSEDLEYDENACKLAADLYCAMAALYSVDRYEFREQLHPRDSIGRFSKVRSLVERPDIANHHSLFALNQDTPTMLYVTDTMKGFRNLIAEASRRQQAKGGDGSEESLWQEIDKDKLRKMLAEVNAKDKEMRKNGGKGLDELFNYNGVIPKMIAERLSGGSRFFDPQKLKAKWHEQAPPPPAPKPDPAQAPSLAPNISIDIPKGKRGKQATSAEPKAPEKPHDGLSTRKRNEVNKVIADLVSDNPEVIEEFRPILIDAWKRKSAEVNDRNNGFRQILGIFGKPKPGEATKPGEVTGMSPAQLMNLVKAARNKTLDPSTKKNFDVMVASAEAGPYGHLLEGNGEEGLMSLIEEGIKPMPDILDDDVAQLALGMAGPSFFQGFDPGEAPEDMPSEWEETPFSSHAAREYYRANFMETIGFDAYSQNHWEDQVRNNLGQWVTKDGLPSVQDTVPQGATLSKTVTDFAEQHFRGKRFRNSEQGWEILVDNRSIKKIAGRGNPSAFCLLAIDELIKNSVLLDSKPSIDNHPNEIAWHYFASPIIIGGKTHAAKLSVKETRTHGNKLYNLHAIEIEKGKPQEPARAKHTTQTLGFPSAVSIDKAWDKIKSGSDIYQFLIAPERYSHPSKAQAEAGNYRMKHVRIAGLDISIETPKGKRRRPEWPPMAADYGYIKGTTGKDGDHLDVFVGPKPNSEVVYVIDQSNKDGGFDEHKIMLGFIGMKNAVDCYKRCYTPGWKVGPVTAMTIGQFKNWIRDGKHKKPIEMQVSKYSSKIGRKYGWNEEDHPRGQPENKGQFVGTFPKKPTEDQIPSESNPHVIAGDMVAPRSQFKLKLLPLDRLTPTEDTDTPKIVDKYEKRFRNRKPVHPIVVDRFGKIRDGHHRFYAAKRAGLTHIWAMRQNSIRDMQQEQ